MARAGGGRACAPHDCPAVTVMAGSGGIQTAPSEGWGHSQSAQTTYCLYCQGRGRPLRGARCRQRGELQTDSRQRQMGGGTHCGRVGGRGTG